MINRRKFLTLGGTLALSCATQRAGAADLLFNSCLPGGLPDALRNHELVRAAWDGIDPAQYWDCHTHLLGVGDANDGTWINPHLRSLLHPVKRTQFAFYLNAACVTQDQNIDEQFVARLRMQLEELPTGAKAMLLAFDYYHDEDGRPDLQRSTFHTPNEYAAQLAQRIPERFEWIASIHPYRPDAVEALNAAIARGARAVKWLPPAMAIDPSSPRCDAFYATLARHHIPLLTHAGHEHAVDAAELQRLGNPLLLRRALDHGVRVIIAHCASLGENADLDRGPAGPQVPNIELFARLMRESRYEKHLFGDISAITQINRSDTTLRRIFTERDWHPRLVNGSDYPLPGIVPLFWLRGFVRKGYLARADADVLSQIRSHNALLFDFLLKRRLTIAGATLPPSVFQTRARFFAAA